MTNNINNIVNNTVATMDRISNKLTTMNYEISTFNHKVIIGIVGFTVAVVSILAVTTIIVIL